MAAYNKFNIFVQDVCSAKHDFSGDQIKVGLTNTAPNVADTIVDTSVSPDVIKSTSNAAEIAAGNGYTEGGSIVAISSNTQTGGTYTLGGSQVVFTAAGGTIAAFRYAYMYNNTKGAAGTRPPIAWWDYASSVTLQDGETFTIKFNNANPGTIFTLV